ncbi:MAG: glycoside hydrolase family 125 protein [Tidjanibacter sp.]|nr:glycoside hydrolase family 125 protein [Tidjanibacter sp.]
MNNFSKILLLTAIVLCPSAVLSANSLSAPKGWFEAEAEAFSAPTDHAVEAPRKQKVEPSPYAKTNRPAESERLFRSTAVEAEISRVKSLLTNERLAWMFENCLPNTLDTTVHYRTDAEGNDDTFVYTGDIHAMWLRDSAAQVFPYVALSSQDEELRHLLAGVIRRQMLCINIDPYANAFNDGPVGGEWQTDQTDMKPELHERKWEIDSLCYPLRLAYAYWLATGDTSVFDNVWIEAIGNILNTFRNQQRKSDNGAYSFLRRTDRQLDTVCNNGWGNPVNPVGLIASTFRPSDDATTFLFLVPSNFFAVSALRKASEILTTVNHRTDLASECTALADEVEGALRKYATVDHPKFGTIYAFEVDGFGNSFLMDDANVPSLLAMPYLETVSADDPIYQNTRRFVWSSSNPYFFKGTAGEGIGGPHIGYDMIWPMSIMMRAFTSTDDAEIKESIEMLMSTDAGTGFIHESFHKDDPQNFTRKWFAWQNTLFGELILRLVADGKTELLNSITIK